MFLRTLCVGLVGLSLGRIHAAADPAVPAGRNAPALYARFCADCHGADLRGGKVSSLLDERWRHGGDDEDLLRVMRDGLPASGMPAFGRALDEAELRTLIVYIRETARRAAEPAPELAKPLPDGPQDSEEHRWRAELVVEGFDVPWSAAFLPDGRLLVTDRGGTLYSVTDGRIDPTPVAGVPAVRVRDEGGLMSVVPHPDHARNGWLYLTFSDPGGNDTAMTKVVRGRLRDGRFVDRETIFSAPREAYTDNGTNFGSRLVFAGDYLFFTVGERGAVGQAQHLSRPNGKIHRVLHDGRVPPDNPFVATPGAVGSIWSYGHRNPQGLALDPVSAGLWATEHGPRGGDELNHIERGHNYGWPLITHGMNYDGTPVSPHTEQAGLDQPVMH